MQGLIEKLFAFCCATMKEMGGLFHMSYQKINVILFCYVEPILFFFSMLALLYVLFRIPGYVVAGKVSLWIMWVVIGIVVVLLGVSATRVLTHMNDASQYFSQAYNDIEPSYQMNRMFNGTVDWLNKAADIFHTTYETVNIWVYILIMPIGIIASMVALLKNVF